MSGYLNTVRATDLRPGDIIWIQNYAADLIEVFRAPCGAVVLRWGFDDTDTVAVWGDRTYAVLGRMPC